MLPEDPPLEEIVDIRDPAIDAEAVMKQIRARIHQRRMKAEAGGTDLGHFLGDLNAEQTISFGHDTDYNLRRLSASYSKVNVGLVLTASRLPIFGPLWQRIRKNLHHLVLFYANMVASKQTVFNKYVVHTFAALIKELIEKNERMAAEMNALKDRVIALETVLEHRESE